MTKSRLEELRRSGNRLHEDINSYDLSELQPAQEVEEDINAYSLEELRPEITESDISQGEAAWEGVKQGVSFGFSDEFEAMVDSGEISGEEYEAAVAEVRDRQKRAAEDWTKTYYAADIGAGIVSGMILPWGKAAQTGSVLAAAKTGAKIAAAEGAVAGYGYGEGDAKDHAISVALGTFVGGAAGGTLGALMKGAPKYWKNLGDGKATKEMQEEAIDLIGRADDIAIANQNYNNLVLNTVIEDGSRLNIKLDDITGTPSDDAVSYARKFLDSKFGGNTQKYIDSVVQPEAVEPKMRKVGEFGLEEVKPINTKEVADEAGSLRKEMELDEDTGASGMEAFGPDSLKTQKLESDLSPYSEGVVKYDDKEMAVLKAYAQYRQDLILYMESVTNKTSTKPSRTTADDINIDRYEINELDPSYLENLHERYMIEVNQGRATRESWNTHKIGL